MTQPRILAVMDPSIDQDSCQALSAHYDVKYTQTLRPTLQQLKNFDPELIIIDIDASTPGKVKRITQAASSHYRHPFILLTKSGRSKPRCASFYDKHLSKPFIFKKLKRSIDDLLASRSDFVIQLSPFILDTRTQVIETPAGRTRLNHKMTHLMKLMLLHPRQPLNPMMLMKDVWQRKDVQDARTLHVHVRWLRQIIEEDASNPEFLKTIPNNKGYILDIPGQAVIGGEPLLIPA